MNLKATMNKQKLLGIAFLLLVNLLSAQRFSKSYFFEGDEIVFEFDRREYKEAYEKGTGQKLDFSDLKIHEIIVTGAADNWTEDSWIMKKISRNKYQLRKKIWEFNDPFSWEFKFLVNGRYVAEPIPGAHNGKILSNDFLEDTYDLKLYDVKPDINGNAYFYLKGFLHVEKVILAGSFNGWDEEFLRMSRTDEGWELRLNLSPGDYHYKFIADGQWLHDPANPKKVRNEHNTFNSILSISKVINFQLAGFTEAKVVVLAGSFNGWNTHKTKLKRQDNRWVLALDLPPGKHYYKFIVDGKWITDPANPLKEQDHAGNMNSILLVR